MKGVVVMITTTYSTGGETTLAYQVITGSQCLHMYWRHMKTLTCLAKVNSTSKLFLKGVTYRNNYTVGRSKDLEKH